MKHVKHSTVKHSTRVLVFSAGLVALAGSAALAQQAPNDETVYFRPTPPAFAIATSTTSTTVATRVEAAVVINTTTTRPVQVAGVQVEAAPAAPLVEEPKTQVLGTTVERPVAFTGANSKPLAVAGLGLTGLGAFLLLGARRRKQSPSKG